MRTLDEQIARRLTRFYVVALAAIALLTAGGLLMVRQTIHTHNDDGRVLNVAGRQRMLSQRLTKLVLLRQLGNVVDAGPRAVAKDGAANEQRSGPVAIRKATPLPALSATATNRPPPLTTLPVDTVSFGALLATWSRTQVQLRVGTLRMEKPYTVRKSPPVDSMLAQIEPVFMALRQSFGRLGNPALPAAERQAALRTLLRDEPRYLAQMDAIVFRLDADSRARVAHLERVEGGLGATTLLVLLLEALFIFRPVVRHTQRVVERLARSETSLRTANDELRQTNQLLHSTQADLVRLTEASYARQRAADDERAAALLEGQEDERRRFARELHDGIGQMLTALNLLAGKLAGGPFASARQQQRLTELYALVQETLQATRQISHNLMPSVLVDFGLAAQLQTLAEQTARSAGQTVLFDAGRGDAGVATPADASGAVERLPPAVEIGLYRIAQEALTNALRHADASLIRLGLHQTARSVTLTVDDNGRGFRPATAGQRSGDPRELVAGQRSELAERRKTQRAAWPAPTASSHERSDDPPDEGGPGAGGAGGSGLANMQARARLLNGRFWLRSAPGTGTQLAVTINLNTERSG